MTLQPTHREQMAASGNCMFDKKIAKLNTVDENCMTASYSVFWISLQLSIGENLGDCSV